MNRVEAGNVFSLGSGTSPLTGGETISALADDKRPHRIADWLRFVVVCDVRGVHFDVGAGMANEDIGPGCQEQPLLLPLFPFASLAFDRLLKSGTNGKHAVETDGGLDPRRKLEQAKRCAGSFYREGGEIFGIVRGFYEDRGDDPVQGDRVSVHVDFAVPKSGVKLEARFGHWEWEFVHAVSFLCGWREQRRSGDSRVFERVQGFRCGIGVRGQRDWRGAFACARASRAVREELGNEPLARFDADTHPGGSRGVHADVVARVLVSWDLLIGDLEDVAHDSLDAIVLGIPPGDGDAGIGVAPITKGVRVRHTLLLRDFGEEFAVGHAFADFESDTAFFFPGEIMPDVRFGSHRTGR